MKAKFMRFSEKIFSNKKILIFLILANISGFFIGLYFYLPQLMTSSPVFWPIIIDSPLSVLLFAIVCLMFYLRKTPPEPLKLLACVYVIKYGIWTMLTLWLYWTNYVFLEDKIIGILDFFLHLGMVLEGLALIPKIKSKIYESFAVALYFLFNDYCDYFLGTVTRIPPDHLNFLAVESVVASIGITSLIFLFNLFHNKQS